MPPSSIAGGARFPTVEAGRSWASSSPAGCSERSRSCSSRPSSSSRSPPRAREARSRCSWPARTSTRQRCRRSATTTGSTTRSSPSTGPGSRTRSRAISASRSSSGTTWPTSSARGSCRPSQLAAVRPRAHPPLRLSARHRLPESNAHGPLDTTVSVFTLVGSSISTYVSGILLITIFCGGARLVPRLRPRGRRASTASIT